MFAEGFEMLQRAGFHTPHFGGFESTKIHGSGTDILETTNHLKRWRDDLEMLNRAGVQDVRYSVPWHRIEPRRGTFEFEWMDGPLRHMREMGMRPILDFVHHTSFPDWLQGGFANEHFPESLAKSIERFLDRYQWIDRYTIFNEPLATTVLCSQTGIWYPHGASEHTLVATGLNVARAICLVDALIRRQFPLAEHVYIDTCENHTALDPRCRQWAHFLNVRRFWLLDTVLGRVSPAHPLYEHLKRHGMSDRQAAWFADHPSRVDILGLDYYFHSEMAWGRDEEANAPKARWPVAAARGFADIATEYVARYRLPVMLAETNIRGFVSDRLTWLRFMEEQCELLQAIGTDFRGFCWYPSIDSTDWDSLCTRCNFTLDPQGIWFLDRDRWTRSESELSECYASLAKGTMSWRDIPAYRFLPPLDRELSGFERLMNHWTAWVNPDPVEEAA